MRSLHILYNRLKKRLLLLLRILFKTTDIAGGFGVYCLLVAWLVGWLGFVVVVQMSLDHLFCQPGYEF